MSDAKVLKFDLSHQHSLSVRARAFIFSDPKSKLLLPVIERTAPSDAPVLIGGETGTGKELVARYVHRLSKRANKPFVAVNCGAFSETMIESELFGHEKGAFTGATAARKGWFEAANGGTLFLDEIGDLPIGLQVKLLRVLQEQEVIPLGARTPVPTNVRLIAATNVDLLRAVEAKRFRADLYYRLQVVSLPLLPLRERPADILPLARHFLEIYAERQGADPPRLTLDAEELLFAYPWPGNIRELENIIHRATLVCNDGVVRPMDLSLPTFRAGFVPPSSGIASPTPVLPYAEPDRQEPGERDDPLAAIATSLQRLFIAKEPDLLNRLTDLIVTEAHNFVHGNQGRTATLLGVTRNVIRTHLKHAGIISRSE